LRLGLLIEGDAANPLVLARFDSASIGYGAYPLLRPAGAAALRGTDAEILRASARYGPLDATLEGSVTLGKHTDFELLSSLAAEPNGLPYASLVIPGMPLTATAVIAGTDAAADALSGRPDRGRTGRPADPRRSRRCFTLPSGAARQAARSICRGGCAAACPGQLGWIGP
jgi:hypothetical protein